MPTRRLRRGRSTTGGPIHVPPVDPGTPTNLAMPRGPIGGFAEAADFYDSVGVAHHPEYLYYFTENPNGELDTLAIQRIQELGLRHIRLGMYSPANYGADQFYTGSGRFGVALKNANAARGAGVQPINALWGTTEEPTLEATRGSAVYTMSTFLRPLEGAAGSVPGTSGLSSRPFNTTRQLDDFEGTTIGGNWNVDPFGLSAVPAVIDKPPDPARPGQFLWSAWKAGTGGFSEMYWNAGTYATKIEAWVTLLQKDTSANAAIYLGIVQQPGSGSVDGYRLEFRTDTNNWSIYRYTNGASTRIAGPTAGTLNAFDRVGLEVKSGVVTGYVMRSGNNTPGGNRWTPAISAADATYTFTTGGGRITLGAKDPNSGMRLENFGGGDTALLENAGSYFSQGWITAGGLQGPNEPDNGRTPYWDSIRATLRELKDAKNARPAVTVAAAADYIDSTTGRITTGPANASQLPIVAPHLTGNDFSGLGSYSDGADVDVGNRHTYWGGHGPSWFELTNPGRGMWGDTASYTGLPRYCTESGYQNRPGTDQGGGERYTPAEVTGEYLIRTLVTNYLANVRRTYLYKLCDEADAMFPPWNYGMTDYLLNRRAAFYAIKNLMTLVGWTQGPNTAPPPITVTGFTPGSTYTISDGYPMEDYLHTLVLRRSATQYLVILCRQREIWDRGLQSYINVSDPKTVTVNLPPGTIQVEVAEPAKNQLKDPVDGLTYLNPGDGTAYRQLTPAGSTASLQVAGLTRVVRITTT